MKIHKREKIVTEAQRELIERIFKWKKRWVYNDKLTDGEELRVLASLHSDWLATKAKYMIRDERHPDDPDRPGGLE